MDGPMSDEQLTEIRDRERKVPPAPWHVVDDGRTLKRWILSENGELEIGLGYVGNRTEDVAAFVVHAREDVPALLAEVERLRTGRCSCDGDPIECSHEAARGQAEAEVERLRVLESGERKAWANAGAERDHARQDAADAQAAAREAHADAEAARGNAAYWRRQADRLRGAWESARRGRRAARAERDERAAEVEETDADLAEERLTVDALRKNRNQLHGELRAARDQLAEVRSYAESIARSDNTAYAKAGRKLLDIVGPVTVAPGTPAAMQACPHRDFDDPTRCLICHP